MQLAQSGALTESCQQLSAILRTLQSAASAGCRYKPAAGAARPSTGGPEPGPEPGPRQPRRDHRPFFDRECKSLKRLYQRVRSSDPEMARVLRHKYAHVPPCATVVGRKCTTGQCDRAKIFHGATPVGAICRGVPGQDLKQAEGANLPLYCCRSLGRQLAI